MSYVLKAAWCTTKQAGHAVKETVRDIPEIMVGFIKLIPVILFIGFPSLILVGYIITMPTPEPDVAFLIVFGLMGFQCIWLFAGILLLFTFEQNYNRLKKEGKCAK